MEEKGVRDKILGEEEGSELAGERYYQVAVWCIGLEAFVHFVKWNLFFYQIFPKEKSEINQTKPFNIPSLQ